MGRTKREAKEICIDKKKYLHKRHNSDYVLNTSKNYRDYIFAIAAFIFTRKLRIIFLEFEFFKARGEHR